MTRFIFITDTHLGAEGQGFQQQPRYPEYLPQLIDMLKKFIIADGSIDFVLHGGDMIDKTSEYLIQKASEVFKLPCPVYLSPGNHDLTQPDAIELWLKHAPEFFVDGPESTLETSDCTINLLTSHWFEQEYYWLDTQDANFKEKQLNKIKEQAASAAKPQILLTHSPVFAIPQEQTGFSEPYHDPGDDFRQQVTDLVAPGNFKVVIGAHNHLNSCLQHEGIFYVTASSFCETPFEFKLFEVNEQAIKMETLNLFGLQPFDAEYDFDRTFAQGRPMDRTFESSISV